jgi:hypothetical protein
MDQLVGEKSLGPGGPSYRIRDKDFYLGRARKNRSSMGMVGVRGVEVLPSARAICLARPLRAGAAGLEESAGASPGCMEMHVVLGVQFGVFKQVSRKKTWRRPLLGVVVEGAACGFAADDCESWLGVTATNATKRPEELIEGRMASVPVRAPAGSVEISEVSGLHAVVAPVHISRR